MALARVGVSQGAVLVVRCFFVLHLNVSAVTKSKMLMMSRKAVISLNGLGRKRELLQQSPRDCRIARYMGDSSNLTEHKLRSPHSQSIGLGLLHGAGHLPTSKLFLLVLLLSILEHCVIYLLQMIFRVMIIYQSCSGEKIVLRHKLLSMS